MKTALEQLESWIEQFYKINGTPTLDDIKGQINLLKDYETEQLAIPVVSDRRELLIGLLTKWMTERDCLPVDDADIKCVDDYIANL